jgi:shikimate kinase
MNVVLIGYRGSGKTTVGREVARKLRLKFLDIDEVIVRGAGKNIRQIFAEKGEAGFREMEMGAIAEAVKVKDHVIAVGGGALGREENRKRLKSWGKRIIFLHCRAEILLGRIQGDAATADNRPNLTALGGGIEEIQKMLIEREPIYRLIMTDEVDVSELNLQKAVERVVEMIQK